MADRSEINIRRYQTKPVVVEVAGPLTWANAQQLAIWCGGVLSEKANGGFMLIIPTLEGKKLVGVGDYLIRGAKGEFYPCKSDVFKAIYEPEGTSSD